MKRLVMWKAFLPKKMMVSLHGLLLSISTNYEKKNQEFNLHIFATDS